MALTMIMATALMMVMPPTPTGITTNTTTMSIMIMNTPPGFVASTGPIKGLDSLIRST